MNGPYPRHAFRGDPCPDHRLLRAQRDASGGYYETMTPRLFAPSRRWYGHRKRARSISGHQENRMFSRTTALVSAATAAAFVAMNGLFLGRPSRSSRFDDLGEPSRFASMRHRYR